MEFLNDTEKYRKELINKKFDLSTYNVLGFF